MGFGRLRWPSREKDAPRPSPNLSLLSRMAGCVSVLRVTDDCDEKGRRQVAEMGTLAASHISKAASRGALGTGLWELGVESLRSICLPTLTK
jgi:hypothetical protein